jgi:hypothetical protein
LLSATIVEEFELVWVCCGWRTPILRFALSRGPGISVKFLAVNIRGFCSLKILGWKRKTLELCSFGLHTHVSHLTNTFFVAHQFHKFRNSDAVKCLRDGSNIKVVPSRYHFRLTM